MRALANRPLAIARERLPSLLAGMLARHDEPLLTRAASRVGDIVVLPLYGVLTPRGDWFGGGTALVQFERELAAAMSDPRVLGIVLDIDSPGGLTDHVAEAAAAVRAARRVKPVWAVANSDATSAAYWIAAQASRLLVTPSGHVGSIGVYAIHEDVSMALENVGIRPTVISAGRYKTEATPFAPLSEEARDALQGLVDAMYQLFIRDVARGRGRSVDEVRNGFGEGRVVDAARSEREGMVDGIGTLDDALSGIAAEVRSARAQQVVTTSFSTSCTTMGAAGSMAGPIQPHSTPVVDVPWDGGEAVRRCPAERRALRALHAWVDEESDPDSKSAYKFPHHMVDEDGTVGAANVAAVRNGLARLPQALIPEGDRPGVEAHLRRHLDDFQAKQEGEGREALHANAQREYVRYVKHHLQEVV